VSGSGDCDACVQPAAWPLDSDRLFPSGSRERASSGGRKVKVRQRALSAAQRWPTGPRAFFAAATANPRCAAVFFMNDAALPSPPVSLLRFLCSSGLQRHRASQAIEDSNVCVNGEVIRSGCTLVYSEDAVTVDGQIILPFRTSHVVVIAYNKPCGIEIGAPRRLCTRHGAASSFELLLNKLASDLGVARLFAIGRLDKETSGLLLITNDGALSSACRTPGLLRKVYVVTSRLRRVVRDDESFDHVAQSEEARARSYCQRLTAEPILLSDGPVEFHEADVLSVVIRQQRVPGAVLSGRPAAPSSGDAASPRSSSGDGLLICSLEAKIKVSLSVGRFRVVRRAVAAAGLPVGALHRCRFGPVELNDPDCSLQLAPCENSLRVSVPVGHHATLGSADVQTLWRSMFGERGRDCMADLRVEALSRLCAPQGSRACDSRLQAWLCSHSHKFAASCRPELDDAESSDGPD
jgi:pseudouridine synthase